MARHVLDSFDDPTVRFLTTDGAIPYPAPARKILPARPVILHVSSVSAVSPISLALVRWSR